MLAAATVQAGEKEAPEKVWVYIGTYTGGGSEGIYLLHLDTKSGEVTNQGVVGKVANPSFLAIHPDGKHLYSVNETSKFADLNSGGVTAFAIDRKSGQLKMLNQQASQGAGPCHIVVDEKGQNALVANYGGGSVAALPIKQNGELAEASSAIQHEGSGADPRRQKAPHAHSINLDPANKFAFAADLGLDKVLIYGFDAKTGKLSPHGEAMVDPASGPRHFAFHPSGKFAYVINEMKNTVTAFSYDPEQGKLTKLQVITTLPEGYDETSHTAEVQVHKSGKFLYGSNRGHDSIAVFEIDQETGKLTARGHQSTGGQAPRNFGQDPSGQFLLAANQNSGNVVVFRINQKDGSLKPTGHEVEISKPVCVKFLVP